MEELNDTKSVERFALRNLALRVKKLIDLYKEPSVDPDVDRFLRKRSYDVGLGELCEASKVYGSAAEERAAFAYEGAALMLVDNPEYCVDLSYSPIAEVRETYMGDFADAPDELSFPAVCIFPWSTTVIKEETPYGMLPSEVIVPNGSVFLFQKKYYIDEKGKAFKSLIMQQMTTPEETVSYVEHEKVDLPNIDIQPSEEEGIIKPLESKEIESITLLVDRIESGKFKPRRQ